MVDDKEIKVQINEYHKLLEDLKVENIMLQGEFVADLLIEKLPKSWNDYKNQLKHKHKQLSLEDLVVHIIIEETNRKELQSIRVKEMASKANLAQGKSQNSIKRHEYKNKTNYKPKATNPSFKKKKCSYFVCGKLGHYAPQCRKIVKNDKLAQLKANLVEADDIIITVISQANIVAN